MTRRGRPGALTAEASTPGLADVGTQSRPASGGDLATSGFFGSARVAGARFAAYDGSLVPAGFGADLLGEYWACRERALALDLSAQHKVAIEGPDAKALLQATTTRDLDALRAGRVALAAICDEDGLLVDAGTLFCFSDERYWFVGDTTDAASWLDHHRRSRGDAATVRSMDRELDVLAVQGPASATVVAAIACSKGTPPGELSWFSFCEAALLGPEGAPLVVSRTGFSGERGYELWCAPSDSPTLWHAVMEAGRSIGLLPGGWEVLHVLRIEAGPPFPGIDYTRANDPFEAGLAVAVSRQKAPSYVGKAALADRLAHPRSRLVGLRVEGGAPPESGAAVLSAGSPAGVVTSAAFSPLLRAPLAFARIDPRGAAPGRRVEVTSGGWPASLPATVGPLRVYDPDRRRLRGTHAL